MYPLRFSFPVHFLFSDNTPVAMVVNDIQSVFVFVVVRQEVTQPRLRLF